MGTIEEMENSMTLFYSKRTGEIKGWCSGIQNMSFYGDDAEDYSIIWDFVVLPKDTNVMQNSAMFKINTETKILEIKSEYSFNQYPVAN